MLKTLKTTLNNDREKFKIPRSVQDIVPIDMIYPDGIFKHGKTKYSKSYRFMDINYNVASKDDQLAMKFNYWDLLNSLDSSATTKITINNRRLNKVDFEKNILIPLKNDELDTYRKEYNEILMRKATDSNSIIQEKYVTISTHKKDVEDARAYFRRIGADLMKHFSRLGSFCIELDTEERLRIAHDFYRQGEEAYFNFDMKDKMQKGHHFKDYICADSYEFDDDYYKFGDRYGRVLFLKEFATFLREDFISALTGLSRNMMLSIDVVPIPMDEAIREVENRLLGVDTNISATRS